MSNEMGENQNGFRVGPKPVVPNEYEEETSKYLPATDPSLKPEFEDLGDLPSGYDQIFLIARDPHWLFTYWDFDYSKFPAQRQLKLRVFRGSELESTIDLNELARNWYVPVQAANTNYRVVFGLVDREGAWRELGSAGPTRTPPESVSTNWDTEFATVPFHLSFNLLLDVIAAARRSGEPLAEALARLQHSATSGSIGEPSSWGFDQIRVLETLLGKQTIERLFSLDSAELSSFLRAEIHARLDSELSSENLAKSRLAELLLPAESSLFSGSLRQALAQEIGSGGVSSFRTAPVGGESSLGAGLSSETGASWQQAQVGGSWESAASSFGLSSREFAERPLALGETSSLASEQSLGVSSLESIGLGLSSGESIGLGLSSQEILPLGVSSGESFGFGLSSAEFGSAELGFAALSSEIAAGWSGLQFELSSWNQLLSESSLSSEVGASWSGQPVGYGERGFFMHVNAEVIFYGGTDPQAKVTVAGESIALQPDGTFRYHFKFPDGDFEIPIIATSPDGVETRSATLTFRRKTSREGEVGATGQPAQLGDTMGRR
jgi:Domain of unknown function (DUF4912)